MKKITILFLAFLTLFSSNVFAYNLLLAGVHITDENKDDITVAINQSGQNASGTITYNPTTNTLTLDGASINANVYDGIENEINNLTINLIGENTISADYGIYSNYKDFTITGNGSLTINADFGIYPKGCSLNIENTTVTAIGSDYGICGDNSGEVLTITNSTVKATGTNQGSIANINTLVLNGCAITQPAGAVFDNHAVRLNGEIVTTEILIAPAYDIWVADVQVTDVNKDDISAAVVAAGHTATGAITYNPTSNTLTLENASINTTNVHGIENYIPNLRINLVDENYITANYIGIKSEYANLIITGTGSLTITAGNSGIYHNDCNLTIENTTITANGNAYGICGYYGNSEVLSITNSTVRATGTNQGSIVDIHNLVLNGCFISQPEGAAFDEEQRAVCLNGEIVTTEVVIEFIEYDLYVNEIQVTSNNANDILENGTVNYDPTNNILTLENATITCNNQGIESQIENLTINLVGQNTITSKYCILIEKNTTITGTGSLYATTINGIGIYQNNCNLTIDNTTVTANGSFYGICGSYGTTETLTINNSTVKATGAGMGSITQINNLLLNDCAITQPEGAIFDASQHAVCLNGEITKAEVVIAAETAQTIYTVSGTVLDNENNPLADVTITYNGGTTTTVADGTYSFTADANTNYTVTPTLAGYTFEPASLTVNVVDADVTEIDFVGTANAVAPATYTVSGTVTDGTNPIADVTITYNGGTTTTAADGTYSFTAIENTTYTVTPSKTGYSFTPATKTVNVVDADLTGVDFVGTAIATYTVSGTVTVLADDSPIEGVTITYEGGGINGTTTTAADGTYSFTAYENTTYTVIANKIGFSFAPTIKTVNVAEANLTGIDFYGIVTYIVEGIVKDATNDNPIAGVTISYTGGSTTTASDGIFSFTAEANTTYIVTPSKAGYKFTPATKTVNVAEANVTGIIFYGTADGTPVDETEINAITVYPNPANDHIKVAGLTGNEEILVFDINGRVVKTLEANNNIETISINDLAKGSYMIKVRKENKIEVLKFIK